MELPRLVLLLSFLLLSRTIATVASAAAVPPPTTAPPPAANTTPAASPSPTQLDPKQLSALQSMNLPTARDPCSLPPPRSYATCDSSSPFRHLVSLTLANCSSDLDLSTTALRSLSPTLLSLSFLRCPIPAVHLPSQLSSTLRSFSCVSSLRRLTGVYLSRLPNLTHLTVVDSPIAASGPSIILSQMHKLQTLTISNANLSGLLPRHWHSLNLTHIDLSSNRLKGGVPTSIGLIESLEFLNLSSNALTGTLPDTLADLASLKNVSFASNSLSGPLPETLAELPALVHLDLSSNRFNGTIPRSLMKMAGLKYLNLENNNFKGVMPFNASFIKRLAVLKLGGNENLCYNRTLLSSSSKLKLGIAPCDKYGMPLSPPPDRTAPSDSDSYSADDGGDDGSDKGGGGRHGPNKVVLGVAIGLSCLVFLIIFLVCLSKMCG